MEASLMKVWMAQAYSIQDDEEKAVWGTREFLVALKLEPIEGSERDVPVTAIDENGQYWPDV